MFFFYFLDFIFVCFIEIVVFSDKVNEFYDVNCEVVVVLVDFYFSYFVWINILRKNGGLGYMNIVFLLDLIK